MWFKSFTATCTDNKMDYREECTGDTSLETQLEQIHNFCELKGFSVRNIVLDIKAKLWELPKRALSAIDMLWRSVKSLESGNTAYIVVKAIQILGTGLALVGMFVPGVSICSKVVQLVVYFLKIIFKISEPNIKLMLDPKSDTKEIYDFAGLAERLKSINRLLNAADENEVADEPALNGVISNCDAHIGVDEIGNLKNRIEEMMCGGKDRLMTCLHYLTIFARICTLRHSLIFRLINYLTSKQYSLSTANTFQGFIEKERIEHQNFLKFFLLPTLENVSLVAAFDPSEHIELAAFLTEMRLPLQDLRDALHGRIFLIQPCVDSSALLGRPNAFINAFISDSVRFTTVSPSCDNIHIRFKFTAKEDSCNLFYIQSPFSGKYMYMNENAYCKHGTISDPQPYAQWKVVQVHNPDEDDTLSCFVLCTKQWPNKFIYFGRDVKGLDDEMRPNSNCLFKLIPPGGSPISVKMPVIGNLTEKSQETSSRTHLRQSVIYRRKAALGIIMAFLQERQIMIENDIDQIELFVLDESNGENQDLNSSLESVASIIDLFSSDEFDQNMMDGLQKMLIICFRLFENDFPFGSILRQVLRMCGVIISCIWQTHGIDNFVCRHLKRKDEHRFEIQKDIRALQRFAFFLHEVERCETILERHNKCMINESRICDELGCLENLRKSSIKKHNQHLMATSFDVSAIQLAVTWQKYAVAKYPGHSDLEAKQLRQIIFLQMQNVKLFVNKYNEKEPIKGNARIAVNMPLFIPECDLDVNVAIGKPIGRRKLTGMLLVVIPLLKKIMKNHSEC